MKRLLFTLIAVTSVIWGCKTHYPLVDQRFTLVEKTGSAERGRNLVHNICGPCHYNAAAGSFIGDRMADVPRIAGKIYSANLTASKIAGVLPYYTDAEISYLLKTGINRTGRFIPYMLRPTMAENDINDIIVYLRSKDRAIAARDTTVGHTKLSLLGKMALMQGKPQPFIEGIKRPAGTDEVATGKYLIDQLGCFHCHSKSIAGINYMHAEQSKGYMQGGMKFHDSMHKKVFASNLTPDSATGIGSYSRDAFVLVLQTGITPSGIKVRFPMRQYPGLTRAQCTAIYTYLQALPAQRHKVKGH
jgi:cytochrome c2